MPTKRLLFLAFLAAAAGCSDDNPLAPAEPEPVAEDIQPTFTIANGKNVYAAQCAQCHGNVDGFDLAVFQYSDTNIIRRAVKHVNLAAAKDIVSYIRTLSVPKLPQDAPLKQPGGRLVAGSTPAAKDANFATAVLGKDAWPLTMTRTALLAINPINVPIGLELLPWSDETSSLEWMPTDSLPPAILRFKNNAARNAITGYRATPTLANLHKVLTTVDAASKDPANTIKPCRLTSTVNYKQCFEIRRWVASLSMQYMLRNRLTGFISTPVHLQWWDVGDIARRAYGKKQIPDQRQQHARWMYVGWMFDPTFEPAVYTAEGMADVGFPKHGVFIALRSMVARTPTSFTEDESPYKDFETLAKVVPPGTNWALNASVFALNELLRRLVAGQRPPVAERTRSKDLLIAGLAKLKTKVTGAQYTTINTLANTVKNRI